MRRGLLNEALCSFLSTSNEAVYKVFNETECPLAGQTCNPEVRGENWGSVAFTAPKPGGLWHLQPPNWESVAFIAPKPGV